jgi:hypothetical protein
MIIRKLHQKEGRQRGRVARYARPSDRADGRPRSGVCQLLCKKALELWQNKTRRPAASHRIFCETALDLFGK